MRYYDNLIYDPFGNTSYTHSDCLDVYSGRTQREKDRLAETITEDVVKVLNVDKKEIVIVFQEASHGNWYVSGVRV